MKYFLYTLLDKDANLYTEPYMARSDDQFLRHINQQLKNLPNVSLNISLHRIGEFDNETGKLKDTKISTIPLNLQEASNE